MGRVSWRGRQRMPGKKVALSWSDGKEQPCRVLGKSCFGERNNKCKGPEV